MAESNSNEPAAPATWTVDDLIFQLFDRQDAPWYTKVHSRIKDSEHIKEAIRNNDVDGEVFISITEENLKQDLGIQSLGQRRALLEVSHILVGNPLGATRQVSFQEKVGWWKDGIITPDITQSRVARSPIPSQGELHPSIEPHEGQFTARPPHFRQSLPIDPAANVTPHPHNLPLGFMRNEAPTGPSFTTSFTPASYFANTPGFAAVHNTPTPQYYYFGQPNTNAGVVPGFGYTHPPASVKDESTAPARTLDADLGDRKQQLPNPLDVLEKHLNRSLEHAAEEHLPKEVERKDLTGSQQPIQPVKPKRRVAPELVKGPTKKPSDGFARPREEAVSALTDTGSFEKTFTLVPQQDPNLSIATAQRMRRYFRQSRRSNPKPADLGEWDYLLDLFPPESGEDQALPLYGESDSENGYDEETWKEIENDKIPARTATTSLTNDQVDAAINEAIVDFQREWQEHRLPKAQAKAYRTWRECAKARQRQPRINSIQARRSMLNKREQKYRNNILGHSWRSVAEVKKQCQSLEQTVLDRMDLNHLLAALQSNKEPPRPLKSSVFQRKRPRPVLEDGEEIIESESEDEGFIVDDRGEVGPVDDPLNEDWQPEYRMEDGQTVKKIERDDSKPGPSPRLVKDSKMVPDATVFDDISADDGDDEDPIISPADKKRLSGRPPSPSPRRSKLSEFVKLLDDEPSTSSDTDEENSDLDAAPRLPPTRWKKLGKTEEQAIDLTLSDPMEVDGGPASSTDNSVLTPELNPVDSQREENVVISPRIKLKLKAPAPSISDQRSPGPSSLSKIPSRINVKGIQSLSWETIEDREDRKRALAKAIFSLEHDQLHDLSNYVADTLTKKSSYRKKLLKEGIMALGSDASITIRDVSTKHQHVAYLLTLLFVTFVCARDFVKSNASSVAECNQGFEAIDNETETFFALTKEAVRVFKTYLAETATDKPKSKKRKFEEDKDDLTDSNIVSSDERLVEATSSAHKKRKRAVVESSEAINLQTADRERIMEQEARRKLMQAKLQFFTANNNASYPVNTDEPVVYLDPHIASRVKPHQVNGIQFLWREIIDDPKHQGCLLAHTMGLGKTMQVIALLVTIARCNSSQNEDVRDYIPDHLKTSKTLVLCPVSLLDNWSDEFLMWLPTHGMLGNIYKVNSSSQLNMIAAWSKDGGVLIMSYSLFTSLLKPSKLQKQKRSKEAQSNINKWLLEDPSLVVADEAHTMKNPKTAIASLASDFTTSSRIALTGSPLNNHLAEYHQMINWLAPGYLGSLVQFKAKYVDPIIEGLYADSDASERRLSLRKLHVLKRDLDPKINRADITAIEADLPPKTEYFITIRMTGLQEQAYNMYVDYMVQKHIEAAQEGHKTGGMLFEIIGVMSLLLNHPQCFIDKVDEKTKVDEENRLEEIPESDDAGGQTDTGVSSGAPTPQQFSDDVEVSSKHLQALQRAKGVFDESAAFGLLQDPSMSYRSLIVKQILERAIELGEKTLIFSHSIPSLNYLEEMLTDMRCKFCRIDGSTAVSQRQTTTKLFNDKNDNTMVFLISIKAGGLGLNLQGATRVIIFDFGFNPMWEQQAVGRAYRLGQKKPVFVYRFRCGGTYEDVINNKAVFKDQLFQRVVDKKNPTRYATRSLSDYLKPSKEVKQYDFTSLIGKDPDVLDQILDQQNQATEDKYIRNIELFETFHKEDDEKLDGDDLKAAEAEYEAGNLLRTNPEAYRKRYPAGHLTPTRSTVPRYPGLPATSSVDPGLQNDSAKRTSHSTQSQQYPGMISKFRAIQDPTPTGFLNSRNSGMRLTNQNDNGAATTSAQESADNVEEKDPNASEGCRNQ